MKKVEAAKRLNGERAVMANGNTYLVSFQDGIAKRVIGKIVRGGKVNFPGHRPEKRADTSKGERWLAIKTDRGEERYAYSKVSNEKSKTVLSEINSKSLVGGKGTQIPSDEFVGKLIESGLDITSIIS